MPRNIGKLIAEALKRMEYTQAQLARELDVTPATVSNWISGRTYPSGARITELERVLGPLRPQSEVAQWLRRERDRADLTQGELANRAKVSSLTISNTERGDTTPQRGTIAKLTNALGVRAPGDGENDCEGDNTPMVAASGKNQPVDVIGDMEDFLPHDQDERRRLLDGVMGVYVLTDKNENAVYVGMSGNDIGKRIRDHATRQWYNTQTIRYGKYIRVDNADICSRIESILIRLLRPQINKQHN